MAATNQVNLARLENAMILGELSLDGNIRGIQGGLPIAIAAKENGIEDLILPAENAKEAANRGRCERLPGHEPIRGYGVPEFGKEIAPQPHALDTDTHVAHPEMQIDLLDVKGQEHVKRALRLLLQVGITLL